MEGTRIYKNFHQWLIPSRAVVAILALASVSVFVGIVLLAIGRYLSVYMRERDRERENNQEFFILFFSVLH